MDEKQMLMIVEEYSREGKVEDGEIRVKRVADQKTVFIEETGGSGQAIVMNEYIVDSVTYWAGYSSTSQTVYISHAAHARDSGYAVAN